MSANPPPVKNRMDLDRPGRGISEPWRKYFAAVDKDANDTATKVAGGTIGNLVMLTSSGDIADSGLSLTKLRSVTYSVDTRLNTSHFGKIIKFNSNLDLTCYLPNVSILNVDSWVVVMRLGTGSLRIQAADADRIETSSAGGGTVCSEPGRKAANVKLFLASETQWAILAGTGIWIMV